MGNSQGKGLMVTVVVILALLLLTIGYFVVKTTGQQSATEEKEKEALGETPNAAGLFGANVISKATVEFDVIELSDSQDAAGDIDIDVLEWDATKNEDLVDKNYLNCDNNVDGGEAAVPAMFNGKDIFVDVDRTNMCQINYYKFWASFTAGDSETKLDDVLTKTASDMDDVDGGGTTTTVLSTGKVYLVTVTEGADADEDDVVPVAFLMQLHDRYVGDANEITNGNIVIRFRPEVFSDAAAASKVQISGECSDDEDNSVNLDSGLDGFVHSSLTTATTITADCNIEVEVTDKGYALIFENPLANSNSERSYLQVDPYGTNSTGGWVEYGTSGLTGDVGHTASPGTDANSTIIWEGMDVCGEVITDSSSTDAVKMGTEKIYQSVGSENCLGDLYHTGGSDPVMEIPLHISEIDVDYNAAVDGDSGSLEAASGSSPEDIADINLVGLESTTDMVAQVLSG